MNQSKMKAILNFLRLNLEGIVWITALILLATMSPDSTQKTLCVWHYLGFEHCPGCGLGHSISSAFHGKILQSLNQHPFGIAAIAILIGRSIYIFYQNYQIRKLTIKN